MTLTPEMVERERSAFELFAAEFTIDLTRFARHPDKYKFQQAADAWSAWLKTAEARAQSQRAVGVAELEALRTEVRAQAGLKDNYQDWDETGRMLSALIDRAGGGHGG